MSIYAYKFGISYYIVAESTKTLTRRNEAGRNNAICWLHADELCSVVANVSIVSSNTIARWVEVTNAREYSSVTFSD